MEPGALRIVVGAGLVTLAVGCDLLPEDPCRFDEQEYAFGTGGGDIAIGETRTAERSANTCSHTNVTVHWIGDSEATGLVHVSIWGSCDDNFLSSVSWEKDVTHFDHAAEFDGLGIKNLCGENAGITWHVDVVNNTSESLNQPVLTGKFPFYDEGDPAE